MKDSISKHIMSYHISTEENSVSSELNDTLQVVCLERIKLIVDTGDDHCIELLPLSVSTQDDHSEWLVGRNLVSGFNEEIRLDQIVSLQAITPNPFFSLKYF